ncbi:DUF4160 domain-containing protein [Pseudomonas sp. 6D_7.1_Bac1]|jgi:hypothetical protein|uniref:DUF4160 domain-containing protein n=1 Tax=Pseudomonas sp. 6D_7.1_Bac1 TaxID=2971615 RepID=UPI0021CAD05A|nr:DUF4160 domain-containing protein [Pseudomonas sp. 6D_7.1_Bac1]MCU1750944.1 DUF4160 domain-containing protein [Pseudomonas sp. 6D_7.1_Bac1]
MKVCSYKGFALVVMLRDEHCPPHVHVDAGTWSARFIFSFWHNGVELWDVLPHSCRPPLAVLEGLRQALKQPAHLRRTRSIWWVKLQTTCLCNQLWDWQAKEVVVKGFASATYRIASAHYEVKDNKTLMAQIDAPEEVEIAL